MYWDIVRHGTRNASVLCPYIGRMQFEDWKVIVPTKALGTMRRKIEFELAWNGWQGCVRVVCRLWYTFVASSRSTHDISSFISRTAHAGVVEITLEIMPRKCAD